MMAKASTWILLIVLIANHGITLAEDAITVINDCLDYAQMAATGDWWGLARKVLNAGQPPEDGIPQVLAKLGQLENRMDNMASKLSQKIDKAMETVISRVPKKVELNNLYLQFHGYVVKIESLWQAYNGYKATGKKFNRDTIEDYIQACVSNMDGSLRSALQYMAGMIAPQNSHVFQKSLWEVYLADASDQTWEEKCDQTATDQYKMVVIHKMIMEMEMKALQMMTFCYAMQSIFKNRSYDPEIEQVAAQYVVRSQHYLQMLRVGSSAASRSITRCNPPEHIKDETYTLMEHLFWATIIMEDHAKMNSDCKLTCAETYFDWKTGKNDDARYPLYGRKCPGYVHDCHWLGHATICPTPDSDTYYQWITSGYGRWGGDSKSCSTQSQQLLKDVKWFWSCDPCYCTCGAEYADAEADRAFSLVPVVSNIENNMVIIACRFVKDTRLMRIQIEEGTLGPAGQIVDGTNKWQPLQSFKYIPTASSRGGYDQIVDGKSISLEMYKNYTFLDRNHATIHLDTVECPSHHVLTGMKFGCSDKECRAIELGIRCTPFDYQSGKLHSDKDDTKSVWMTPEIMKTQSPLYKRKRIKIDLTEPDEPSRCKSMEPVSVPNQAVRLRSSDLYSDIGQHTVPGFDMVAPESPICALSGAGVYYKSGKRCGGLISFELSTIDYSRYLKPALTQKELDHYASLAG